MPGVLKNRSQRLRRWGLFASTTAVLVTGLIITVGVWILLTRLLRYHWPWDQRLGHGPAVSQLDITKVALSVVAGVGAAIALTVTYRRQRDAERGRLDERFAAAAAQLGGTSPAERLAGVYAVATMADETPERRQQCIDLLCAYLRLPYDSAAGLLSTVVIEDTWPAQLATRREQRTYQRLPNDREVRYTIIDVICAHLQPDARVPWRGHDFDFTGAVFDGANFYGADFGGSQVYFMDAAFVGGRVDFTGTKFSRGGFVSFIGAVFSGGAVLFDNAEFSGATVRFNGATFSGGSVAFYQATFSGGEVSFPEAQFSGAEVSFMRSTFSGGTVSFLEVAFSAGEVDFYEAAFSGGAVSFEACTFDGGAVSFYEAAFSGKVSFADAEFSAGQIYFGKVAFSRGEVNFMRSTFSGGAVSFYEAAFSGCEVSFVGAQFCGGEVSFRKSMFGGGRVTFARAAFQAGTVAFGADMPKAAVPPDLSQAHFGNGRVLIGAQLFQPPPPPPGLPRVPLPPRDPQGSA